MDTQTAIALTALFISVLSFFVNLWYTHRQFRAVTVPSLLVALSIKIRQRYSRDEQFIGLTETLVMHEIKNLSSSVSISEIGLIAEVAVVTKGSLFLRNRKEDFIRDNVQSLVPLETYNPSSGRNFADFLCEKFPDFFHKLEAQYSSSELFDRTTTYPPTKIENRATTQATDAYQLFKPCRVEIAITVSFRPGTHNASLSKVKTRYIFVPVTQSTEMTKSFISGWDIKHF